MALGDNIRYLREHRGWTQKELGDRLDISDKAVSTWEEQHENPPAENAAADRRSFRGQSYFFDKRSPYGAPENTAERQATVSQGGNTHFSRTLDRLCLSASKPPARVARDMAIPWERFLTLLHGEEPPSKEELGAFAAYFQVPPSTFRPTPAGIKSAAPAPRQPRKKALSPWRKPRRPLQSGAPADAYAAAAGLRTHSRVGAVSPPAYRWRRWRMSSITSIFPTVYPARTMRISPFW